MHSVGLTCHLMSVLSFSAILVFKALLEFLPGVMVFHRMLIGRAKDAAPVPDWILQQTRSFRWLEGVT